MIDLAGKTDKEIDNFIHNHQEKRQTNTEFYRCLIEERARRTQTRKLLDFDKSIAHLKQAAIQQKCVSYGELAEASNVEWKKASHSMNGKGGHLDQLIDLCQKRDLPMLTALCVNQSGLKTGELEETALTGFVDGAKRLGLAKEITDKRAFHIAQRDKCWAWGREQSAR